MTPVPIHLRHATRNDMALLRHWDKQPHVVAFNPNDSWDWDHEFGRDVVWCEQLIAKLDGRPIGFVQIIDPEREETHYWGEDCPSGLRAVDIWIGEAKALGHGYGTRMMELALERCFTPPEVEAVLIDPLFTNTRARRFYERLGSRFVERRRFGADECAVYRLGRADWEGR